jgi:hypothetical protein
VALLTSPAAASPAAASPEPQLPPAVSSPEAAPSPATSTGFTFAAATPARVTAASPTSPTAPFSAAPTAAQRQQQAVAASPMAAASPPAVSPAVAPLSLYMEPSPSPPAAAAEGAQGHAAMDCSGGQTLFPEEEQEAPPASPVPSMRPAASAGDAMELDSPASVAKPSATMAQSPAAASPMEARAASPAARVPSPAAPVPSPAVAPSPAARSPASEVAAAAAALSPVVVPLAAADDGDIFSFRLNAVGSAAAAAAVVSSAVKPSSAAAAAAASPTGGAWAAPPPGSVTRGSLYDFSPSLGMGRYASMQPLGATPTRDETLDVAGAAAASASPAPVADDDTLFEFRSAPGDSLGGEGDADATGGAGAMEHDTPPGVGHGPPSAAKPRTSRRGTPGGARASVHVSADTTLFSYEPESPTMGGRTNVMPRVAPMRPSATEDSLFASTASIDAMAAARAALGRPAANVGAAAAAEPASPGGVDELELTQDSAAYAAALKAKLAAMLAGTPPGDASLEPPSRSPTPLGMQAQAQAMRDQHGGAAATGTFYFPNGGVSATPVGPPGSVLRGLPLGPPPVPAPLAGPGLPRRSLGGAALRRASYMPPPASRAAAAAAAPTAAPTPLPAVAERALAAPSAPPLSYASLLEALGITWKEHVRARRSSVMPGGLGGAAAPPATLEQALRVWCINMPEADAAEALREALEREWKRASSAAAAGAAALDELPPPLASAVAAAQAAGDDAALEGMREDAKRLQRACKDAAKACVLRERLTSGARHLEVLKANAALLAEQEATLSAAHESLADVTAGVAALGVAAGAARSAAAGARRDSAAASMRSAAAAAAEAQRRAAIVAAREETAASQARIAAAGARAAEIAAATAAARARVEAARARAAGPLAAAGTATQRADAAAAAAAQIAAVDRAAEAEILAHVCGWTYEGATSSSVQLLLNGGAFRITAAYMDGAGSTATARAQALPAPADVPLRGRGAPERLALVSALAAPLECTAAGLPEVVRALALRCARATDVNFELDDCIAAFPHLVSVRVNAEERSVSFEFALLQPKWERKIGATLMLPAEADPLAPLEGYSARVRFYEGGHLTPEALTKRVVGVAPGLRRLMRTCAVLDAALMEGVPPLTEEDTALLTALVHAAA